MARNLKSKVYDEYGYSELHNAVASGSIDDVKNLIKQKADIEELTLLTDLTPLHIAALEGKSNIMELLIDCGAQVNAQCRLGRTPLHVIMSTTNVKEKESCRGIQILMSAWADFNLVCNKGLTPLEYGCNEKRCKTLVQYMVQVEHWSGQKLISEQNLRLVKSNAKLDEQFKSCYEELSVIEKTEIAGHIMLDNLIMKSSRTLAAFTYNQDIVDFFKNHDLKTTFPLFGKSMLKKWEKAEEEASSRWGSFCLTVS